ncbi:hypothetical protein [Rhizosphaericola mali]|uniref:Uncharacterized protein n=1 Tax=Rhizosphaericola mali TaxID=2545455 RepID=A0A5P2FY07_9BACT|nr:hypothetical protein [Rhizosphaericola mali]QES88075.1 hypothetical protein E0W69_005145 [Rhizosphaericola mali]
MAAAAVLAIGGAMAKSIHIRPAAAETYYAVQTASGFTWLTASELPDNVSCQENNPNTACEVLSDNGSRPSDNTKPSGSNYHYSDNGSIYK